MKVSIIIPCYNYGRYLDECFTNLQSQSHADWEALVIDDGSTDQTMEIVRDWQANDPRIQYYYQPNSGVSKARNLGLVKARGEFIQFLDADDLLSKNKLRLQVEYFMEHPEVNLCYTDNFYFEDGFPQTLFPDQEFIGKEWMIRFSGTGAFAAEQLIRNNLAVVSSPMIRKSLLGLAGFFPEQVAHTEDWQFWFQCVLAGANIHYLQDLEAFTLIRVHRTSVSQQTQTMRFGELNLRSWISRELQGSPLLSGSEKQVLIRLNENKRQQLFKYIMYHGPLTSISHLAQMAGIYNWKTVLSYYFKALNFRRKSKNNAHSGNRRHSAIQRQDSRTA